MFSAFYGVMMNVTGACSTIARYFMKWFGEERIVMMLCLLGFILCYGGISMFVIWFAIGPILWSVFKKLNIPRVVAVIILGASVSDFVLIAPGSPQIQNVIPTQFLGSTLYGYAPLGFAMLVVGMAFNTIYAVKATAKIRKKVAAGEMEGFVSMPGDIIDERSAEDCPNLFCSLLPMIVLIGFIFVGTVTKTGMQGTELAVTGMVLATLVNILVNWTKFNDKDHLKTIRASFATAAPKAAITALVLGGIAGFGAVVSKTAVYATIIKWFMGLGINGYWKAVISVASVSFLTGSSSGSMSIVLPQLKDFLLSTGISPNVLHTLIVFGSIAIDSMPWTTGAFGIFVLTGTSHKEAYKYIFITGVIAPTACIVVATLICSIFQIGMI
jgi:H+/gluconate symporter-like permease